MEASDTVEKIWRKHCESYQGAIIMSKSSFVLALNEFGAQRAKQQSDGDRWVSVDNRLPEINDEYIVATIGDVTTLYFKYGKWYSDILNKNVSGVIAWQRLPSPPTK